MNYYKRHLGDYAKNTRTLSTYEHGAYNLILDLYYTDESPVSADDAYAICRADAGEDRAKVDRVLVKFFTQENGLWRHKRADSEIAKYREKAQKNKEIGSLGGKQKAKRNATKMLSECGSETHGNSLSGMLSKTLEVPSETLSETLSERGSETEPKPLAIKDQEKKEKSKEGAGAPSDDPDKAMWDAGVALLGTQSRTLIGKSVKENGRTAVMQAIAATVAERPADPKAYFLGVLKKQAEPTMADIFRRAL